MAGGAAVRNRVGSGALPYRRLTGEEGTRAFSYSKPDHVPSPRTASRLSLPGPRLEMKEDPTNGGRTPTGRTCYRMRAENPIRNVSRLAWD